MRLLAYRRTIDPSVVDAVFAMPNGFFHLQRADGSSPEGAKIQFGFRDRMPDLGKVAHGYDFLVSGGANRTAQLELESRWHELVAEALTVPGGLTALARFIAGVYERSGSEMRASGAR